MSSTSADKSQDDLVQLGIRKGSRIWPILSIFVAAILLFVYLNQPQPVTLNNLFAALCQDAFQKDVKVAPEQDVAKACADAQTPEDTAAAITAFEGSDISIRLKWLAISDLKDLSDDKESTDVQEAYAPDKLWPLFAESANLYLKFLIKNFGSKSVDVLKAIGLSALVSLIPGIAGMVYRRSFWSWFLVPFIILFFISSDIIGKKTPEGALLIFVLAQIAIVLLALRLRRYARSTSMIPASAYNWMLAAVLTAIGLAWWFDIGGVIWSSWRGWFQWEVILVGLPILYSVLRRSDVWTGRTPKNIVVCLDGTTNTPDQYEFGRLAQTNVFKLFKMLKSDTRREIATGANAFNASLSKKYGDKQLGLYYSGVGNRFEYNPIVQALGGAAGLGAADVVDRAYLDVIRVYQPGDRIFIFGFSRGAAIARLLARAIDQRGAPRSTWTLRLFGRHWTIWRSKLDGKDSEVPISVLGCFDTVGAFGLAKNIAGIDFQKLDLFKDLTVPDNVEKAYHLVALDEMREEFAPTLMDPDPLNPPRIVEVWFSGDHANIGGGWATTKLSDMTLDFLLKRISSGYAAASADEPGNEAWGIYLSALNGANLDPETTAPDNTFLVHPDPLGQLRQWRSALYVYKPRELPHHAIISETVFQRMTNAVPLYAPASLFNLHDELAAKRDSINVAVKRLKDTNSVSSEEHDNILAFKDRLHLTRWPQAKAKLEITPASERLDNENLHST